MGGMENHCALLCDGLRRAGHEVTLFAAAGTSQPGLRAICDPYERHLPWDVWHGTPELAEYQRIAFESCWDMVERGGFDVVHNNSLYPAIMDWAADAGVPLVTSQHVPPFGPMREAVGRTAWSGQVITLTSESQRALWQAADGIDMRVVPNGVDCNVWTPGGPVGDHLIWSGRITPNKGLVEAVSAAKIADLPLLICGPIEDSTYFEMAVGPLLDDQRRYLGHRDSGRLRELVSSARAALVTPMWDEPFGLVAAEALACGVPVAAFDRGGLREVVGPAGVLAPGGDVEALADALSTSLTLDREACRAHALAHLSVEAMIAGYERCYADAIANCRGGAAASRASSCSSTQALLA